MATSAAAPIPAAGPATGPIRSAREVVPDALWNKQVGLLVRDYPYDSVMAARVLGQGYAYLLTAMNHRGDKLGLAPSSLVDIGVHTIILDTMAYAELCDRFNGGLPAPRTRGRLQERRLRDEDCAQGRGRRLGCRPAAVAGRRQVQPVPPWQRLPLSRPGALDFGRSPESRARPVEIPANRPARRLGPPPWGE